MVGVPPGDPDVRHEQEAIRGFERRSVKSDRGLALSTAAIAPSASMAPAGSCATVRLLHPGRDPPLESRQLVWREPDVRMRNFE